MDRAEDAVNRAEDAVDRAEDAVNRAEDAVNRAEDARTTGADAVDRASRRDAPPRYGATHGEARFFRARSIRVDSPPAVTPRRTLALLALFATAGCVRRSPPARPRRAQHASARDAGVDAARPLEAAPHGEPPRAFRMDALHSGRSGFELPRHPHIRTRIATGARISTQAAVLLDGSLVFGSHDGVVYSADPVTGAVAWTLSLSDRIYASPLVALPSGTVYLGSDADRFFALTPRGRLDVGLATDDDADTSPALAPDGTIRFAAGRTLYSVTADLTVRWRLDFGGKLFSSPAVLADGTTVVGCQDDSVYAVDANGAVRWSFATHDDVDAPPAIDAASGTVFVGSDDGALYALDVATGALRWRRALGGYVRAGVALGLDGSAVVGTYGPQPAIVSVDRATGDVRWRVEVPGPPTAEYGVASAALVDRDGRYAVGTPDDALWLLARDGTVDARVAMPADVDSPPVLVGDGLLAVGCDDGAMYVLGEADRVRDR